MAWQVPTLRKPLSALVLAAVLGCAPITVRAQARFPAQSAQPAPATRPTTTFERVTVLVAPDTGPATAPSAARPASPEEVALRDGVAMLRRDVLQSPFSAEMTIGQAAGRLGAVPALEEAILAAEQPGGPRWRGTTCELRLELPGIEVARILDDAEKKQPGATGLTSESFDRRIAHLRTQRYTATGLSRTLPPTLLPVVPPEAPASPLINDPPDWVGRQIDADGRGTGGGLKGARAAEAVALSQLRTQVEALSLRPGLTIGQVAAGNLRFSEAVTRALRYARVSRVTYGEESTDVRVSFDLDHVWRELVRAE